MCYLKYTITTMFLHLKQANLKLTSIENNLYNNDNELKSQNSCEICFRVCFNSFDDYWVQSFKEMYLKEMYLKESIDAFDSF